MIARRAGEGAARAKGPGQAEGAWGATKPKGCGLSTVQQASVEVTMPGLYLEDFEVGRVFEHEIRRTVTEMDNTLFSCLTHNPQPLHIDHEFASKTEWGKPLVNSLFTLGVMIGISINDTTLGTTIGNLGMSEVKFPKPVFHGDTLRATTEILSKRETRSRPDAGIVEFLHKAYNQRGELVAECRRQGMMRKRPKA
jgi:acyl dehydratase